MEVERNLNIQVYATGLFVNGGMSVYKSYSDWGNIRCVPSIDNNESSLGFFKKSDLSINSLGDVWVIGRNISNLDPHVFSISF